MGPGRKEWKDQEQKTQEGAPLPPRLAAPPRPTDRQLLTSNLQLSNLQPAPPTCNLQPQPATSNLQPPTSQFLPIFAPHSTKRTMTTRYETVFILTPVLSGGPGKGGGKEVQRSSEERQWQGPPRRELGMRKLAYPIQKKSSASTTSSSSNASPRSWTSSRRSSAATSGSSGS